VVLQEGPGDVLVFLTGQDDVDAAVQLINEEAETLPRNTAGIYNSCNLFLCFAWPLLHLSINIDLYVCL
jgi:HrpA-like RNA helicase